MYIFCYVAGAIYTARFDRFRYGVSMSVSIVLLQPLLYVATMILVVSHLSRRGPDLPEIQSLVF